MQLNAWDSRLITEPDYDRRIEGFSEAKQILMTQLPQCHQEEEGEESACRNHGEGLVQWTPARVDMITPHCYTCLFYLLQVMS
jgi:hypothetical protein